MEEQKIYDEPCEEKFTPEMDKKTFRTLFRKFIFEALTFLLVVTNAFVIWSFVKLDKQVKQDTNNINQIVSFLNQAIEQAKAQQTK